MITLLAIAVMTSQTTTEATVAAPAAQTTAPPAQAAPTARSKVSTHTSAARWYTQRNETLGPGKNLKATKWSRLPGVRVMQVKARCWGNDSQIKVGLWFWRSSWPHEKVAKSGKWACNGNYGIVRIYNAGHSDYWASFSLNKKHTVEYWVQYYK
ncbi:hypothetical protein AB0395_26180 [Streptosporangium sp. NPDC051023]|uniref:hypothetical protein n=1 Tax=Streptosporangium sp. NPDC051023 TaxID=3155410 RepID=UPI00344DB9F9